LGLSTPVSEVAEAGLLESLGPDIVLDFDMEAQDPSKDFWCWAAVGVSVLFFLRGESRMQCELASEVLNGFDCCNNPDPCDVMKPLEIALARAQVYRNRVMSPVNPDIIANEMMNQKPLGCAIRWGTGKAHFVVVYGISRDGDGTPWVAVDDPKYGKWQGSYTEFRDAYLQGAGRWIASYFTI